MAKIVTAVFPDSEHAQLAVQDLLNHGIYREDVSIQMTQGACGREFFVDISSKSPEGGVIGTLCGAAIGAALFYSIAGGYLHVEGLPLVRHGMWFSTLTGLGLGAMIGLLLGFVAGAFVPEYESNLYAVDTRSNRVLLGVYCSEKREEEVRQLLRAASGTELRSRSVATEPVRLHTTAIDQRLRANDDLISQAVRANESNQLMKDLKSAKSRLSQAVECINQLESELLPLASRWDAYISINKQIAHLDETLADLSEAREAKETKPTANTSEERASA